MGGADDHATSGTGEGAGTFLLAPGIGGRQADWGPVAAALERHGRVITLDIAGFGDTDVGRFDHDAHASLQGFADDLLRICDELGIEHSTYIGHSLSGMAGVLASIEEPRRFARLVLIEASARYLDDPSADYVGGFSAEAVDATLAAIVADYPAWVEGFAPAVMQHADRPRLAADFAASLRRCPADVALTVFRAALTSDLRDRVARVPVPVLVLNSIADPVVPMTAARWLAHALPQARLVELASPGHFPHIADPDAVIDAITDAIGAEST